MKIRPKQKHLDYKKPPVTGLVALLYLSVFISMPAFAQGNMAPGAYVGATEATQNQAQPNPNQAPPMPYREQVFQPQQGFQPQQNFQPPQNFQAPTNYQAPAGFQPAANFQAPANFQPPYYQNPANFQAQSNLQPPTNAQQPASFVQPYGQTFQQGQPSQQTNNQQTSMTQQGSVQQSEPGWPSDFPSPAELNHAGVNVSQSANNTPIISSQASGPADRPSAASGIASTALGLGSSLIKSAGAMMLAKSMYGSGSGMGMGYGNPYSMGGYPMGMGGTGIGGYPMGMGGMGGYANGYPMGMGNMGIGNMLTNSAMRMLGGNSMTGMGMGGYPMGMGNMGMGGYPMGNPSMGASLLNTGLQLLRH